MKLMKFAYYKTGKIPTHAYTQFAINEKPEDAVRKAGGELARLEAIYTSEDEVKAVLAQDTDPK
jgi:hypothetical protein